MLNRNDKAISTSKTDPIYQHVYKMTNYQTSIITFAAAQKSDEGNYTCKLADSGLNIYNKFTVTLKSKFF